MDTKDEILDPEVAAAKERAAAARAKLEARRAAEDPERAKRAALDDAALIEAQLEHGEDAVGVVKCRLGDVIVRKPTSREAAAFRARVSRLKKSDEGGMRDASKAFVKSCLVHPSEDAFVRILADQDFVLDTLATLCTRLGGAVDSGE